MPRLFFVSHFPLSFHSDFFLTNFSLYLFRSCHRRLCHLLERPGSPQALPIRTTTFGSTRRVGD